MFFRQAQVVLEMLWLLFLLFGLYKLIIHWPQTGEPGVFLNDSNTSYLSICPFIQPTSRILLLTEEVSVPTAWVFPGWLFLAIPLDLASWTLAPAEHLHCGLWSGLGHEWQAQADAMEYTKKLSNNYGQMFFTTMYLPRSLIPVSLQLGIIV